VPQPGLPPPPEGGFRERLLAGMADAVREHGFAETTVAEVVRRARTSRRTFYQHFDDREACFLALCDIVSERLLATIAEAATGEGAWEERVDRAMGAYLGALAADPELTRSCTQEILSVGPEGVARSRVLNRRWARQIMRLVEEAREHDPTLRPLSIEVATVITGGFRDLVIATLEEGRDLQELRAVGGDLIRRITMR
jgi:AcrR family transcriptional regulator